MVKYGYTAYGKITDISGSLAATIGAYNPFRYKGYYYDTETTMYYCKTRYYVPEWCRWLNGDSPEYLKAENINGMNLFSHCQNNPITYVDENGNWGWRDILGKIAGIVVSAAITSVAITLGVATGGVAGFIIAGAIGFAAGFTSSVVEQGIAKGEIDFSRAAFEGIISSLCTAATAGAINGSGIMNQTGFIERAIETCTSDLFNQVKNLATFTLGVLRIGYTAFKF